MTQLDRVSVFQSSAWAEHRRESGWDVERWSVSGGGERAAVQLLLRRKAGVTVAWAPGGPLIDASTGGAEAVQALLLDLFAVLKARHGTLYARLDAPAPLGSPVDRALQRTCSRPAARLNTGMTVVLDTAGGPEAVLARMSKHHRYEVRRASACHIEWRTGCTEADIDALVRLHDEMTARKRIGTAPQAHRAALTSLCRRMDGSAFVLVGLNDGVPVTACLVLTFAGLAFYQTAATGSAGLRCGASYGAVHQLTSVLSARTVRWLDLGGLDRGGPRLGVARFKEGFGGTVVQRTGEWEWASRPGLRLLMNAAAGVRRVALGG